VLPGCTLPVDQTRPFCLFARSSFLWQVVSERKSRGRPDRCKLLPQVFRAQTEPFREHSSREVFCLCGCITGAIDRRGNHRSKRRPVPRRLSHQPKQKKRNFEILEHWCPTKKRCPPAGKRDAGLGCVPLLHPARENQLSHNTRKQPSHISLVRTGSAKHHSAWISVHLSGTGPIPAPRRRKRSLLVASVALRGNMWFRRHLLHSCEITAQDAALKKHITMTDRNKQYSVPIVRSEDERRKTIPRTLRNPRKKHRAKKGFFQGQGKVQLRQKTSPHLLASPETARETAFQHVEKTSLKKPSQPDQGEKTLELCRFPVPQASHERFTVPWSRFRCAFAHVAGRPQSNPSRPARTLQ